MKNSTYFPTVHNSSLNGDNDLISSRYYTSDDFSFVFKSVPFFIQ